MSDFNYEIAASRCPCYAVPIEECDCQFNDSEIELVINSDERGTRRFPSIEAATAYAESLKEKDHVVDLQIYDYSRPIDQECVLSWGKYDGEWQSF